MFQERAGRLEIPLFLTKVAKFQTFCHNWFQQSYVRNVPRMLG